jgi:hypothetical protein
VEKFSKQYEVYHAAGLASYSAWVRKDEKLARSVWKELLNALASMGDMSGFETKAYGETGDGKKLEEIGWIKTNFASQWCLNVIMALEFVREFLPASIKDMRDFLTGPSGNNFRRA